MTLLTANGISKHFDGTQALRAVDLAIEAGEVHALAGENGAGKSTLAKILAGIVQPDSGEIDWNGERATLRNPVDAQRLGIAMIPQELDLFPHLSVAANLAIGNLAAERGRISDAFCAPLLREVSLSVAPGTLAADLSISQRQLLLIARALGMNARLLIMDEPTSALDDASAEVLFRAIARLRQRRVAILYVSHKMDEIFRLADRITVLRDGARVATVATGETDRDGVIAMMVGRELRSVDETARTPPAGPPLLRVEEVSSRKLCDVSFELRAGEVLGVAGLVGSGRSSLGQALFGLDPSVTGRFQLRGQPYTPRSPRHAIRSGIGLVPEDRAGMGLMMHMSVEDNLALATMDRIQRFGLLPARGDTPVATLSGGNQQKVLLRRWLLVGPDVLILDDPTRGIDIGAKFDIYEEIRKLAAAGKGILLISSELPELLLLSDRVLVLHEGRQMGIVDRAEATQERIMALAVGS